MTENEKLRALLAQARAWVAPGSHVRFQIDAALAKPVQRESEQLVAALGKTPPCVSGRQGHTSTCGCGPCQETFLLLGKINTARTVDAVEAQASLERAEKERDEARGDVERLKRRLEVSVYALAKDMDPALVDVVVREAYQRGAEAMRIALGNTVFTTISLHPEPCRRSELRNAVIKAIDELPVPEET